MILAIDFDGTIVTNRFPAIGEPLPGALETLRDLQAAGYSLILWTCRGNHKTDPNKQYLDDAVAWLTSHGITLAAANACWPLSASEDACPHSEFAHDKVFADLYIDDRNLGGFPGWDVVREKLLGGEAP